MPALISPEDAYQRVQSNEMMLIDIREADEYRTASVEGSISMPLSAILTHPQRYAAILNTGKPIVFTCQSGMRTRRHEVLFEQLTDNHAYLLEGGLNAWQKAGLPLNRMDSAKLPIFRQIQIIAGLMVLTGVIGSVFWPPMIWLSGFVGAGLLFAGISGFCGLGIVLSYMPWNR